jgi:hypothetical protein
VLPSEQGHRQVPIRHVPEHSRDEPPPVERGRVRGHRPLPARPAGDVGVRLLGELLPRGSREVVGRNRDVRRDVRQALHINVALAAGAGTVGRVISCHGDAWGAAKQKRSAEVAGAGASAEQVLRR